MAVRPATPALVTAVLLVCAAAWVPRPAMAWWDLPHVLVAEIASRHTAPGVNAAVDALLALDRTAFPALSSVPGVAVWADFIKADLPAFSHWHAAHRPYNPSALDLTALPAYVDARARHGDDDLLTALRSCYGTLVTPPASALHDPRAAADAGSAAARNAHAAAASLADTRPTGAASVADPVLNTLNGAWAKAFALRMTVHLMGDLHQPLHVTEWWDPNRFPEHGNDLGGHAFPVRWEQPAEGYGADGGSGSGSGSNSGSGSGGWVNFTSLGTLFDGCGGQYTTRLPLPVTSECLAWTRDEADRLVRLYPRDIFPSLDTEDAFDFAAFADQSAALARELAYEPLTGALDARASVTEPVTLSADYIESLRPRLAQQIALAGYRLARVLNAADLQVAALLPAHGASAGTPATALGLRGAATPGMWSVALVVALLLLVVGLPIVTYRLGRRHERDAISFDAPSALDEREGDPYHPHTHSETVASLGQGSASEFALYHGARRPPATKKRGVSIGGGAGGGSGRRGSSGSAGDEHDELLQLN